MTSPPSDPPIKGVYLGEEGSPYSGGQLLHNLLLFGRVCRALDMDVTPNRMMEVARALEFVDLGHKHDIYHTMRALMVTHPRDFEFFDEAFDLFWRRPAEGWTTLNIKSMGEERHKRKTQFLPPLNSQPDDGTNEDAQVDPTLVAIVPTYSQQSVLRYKDFAEMTGEELAMAKRIIEKLPQSLGLRRTRRFERGSGRQIDLRKTIRQSMRQGGEVIQLPTRRVKHKPRPVVLICDISGSMERYTRVLLHFMHTLAAGMYRVESFVYSTDLTRITYSIRQKSVDAALHDVGINVKGWGGGTKTGESLSTFNYLWSRRVLGSGAIVMLITDGWDRGDIQLLDKEMGRLQRSCHRLMWLNPLLDSPEYEPLTRGAQAMLPHVDDFLPIRNLANLETIINALQKQNRQPAIKTHHKWIEPSILVDG